jgi:DNA-binding transcriptional LysR family regulator
MRLLRSHQPLTWYRGGLGVSIVPASVAAQIKVKGVVYLPIVGESPAFGLALATRLKEKSTAVQNFRRLAAARGEG